MKNGTEATVPATVAWRRPPRGRGPRPGRAAWRSSTPRSGPGPESGPAKPPVHGRWKQTLLVDTDGAPFNGAPFNGEPFNGALDVMVY